MGLGVVLGDRTIRTTSEHPFWVPEERTFRRADTLGPGDRLLDVHGGDGVVRGRGGRGGGAAAAVVFVGFEFRIDASILL